MLLDFVRNRNNKNVFGTDLWGKAINNVGIYHRLLNVADLYDNEKQEQIDALIEGSRDKDGKITMSRDDAEQVWKNSRGVYYTKEPSIFTSRNKAKLYREGLGRDPIYEADGKTHAYVTREEYGF